MSTPPQSGRLAQSSNTISGLASSPFDRAFEDHGDDHSRDPLALDVEEQDLDIDLFRSPLMQSTQQQNFDYDPSQAPLDSDADLVVPVSRNDLLTMNNPMLQYPPKFEQQQQRPSFDSTQMLYYNTSYMQPPDTNYNTTHMSSMQQTMSPPQQYPYYQYQQYPPSQHDSYPSQHLQQQQQHQSDLYPAMMISPTVIEQDIPLGESSHSQMYNTFSPGRQSSVDSMTQQFKPGYQTHKRMASSQSETAINSLQNLAITPRRPTRRLSTHAAVTPSTGQHQTPSTVKRSNSSRVMKSHRRTRSRLSVDATGTALLAHQASASSSSANTRSPVNPFYSTGMYASPHQESPAVTPLATPQVRRGGGERTGGSVSNTYASISPMMLMTHQQMMSQPQQEEEQVSSDVFAEAASLTMRMASHFAYNTADNQKPQQQQQLQQHSHVPFPSTQSFLTDPINAATASTSQQELQQEQGNDANEGNASTAATTPIISTKQVQASKSAGNTKITRSQSVIDVTDLANENSKLIPPEITKYDILTPRKQTRPLPKSFSSSELTDKKTGRKAHACPLCNAIFQRPEHVKRHMRSHSSEKPFVCDVPDCGKRFNRCDNMKAHLRKIHGRVD